MRIGTPTRPAIELRGVVKAYGDTTVLHGVSLSIRAGDLCAIQGPSGSGKSTLMNLMGLLDRPSQGSLMLDGQDVSRAGAAAAARYRNRFHGFVFQSFQLLPRLSVWENVALPLLYRGVARQERRRLAAEMLARVGLAQKVDVRPQTLSGGQVQRVAIARALVGNPQILLADEPTGSLDSETAVEVMDLFQEINRSVGVTVVIVTHDPGIAAACLRQIHIRDGRVSSDSAS